MGRFTRAVLVIDDEQSGRTTTSTAHVTHVRYGDRKKRGLIVVFRLFWGLETSSRLRVSSVGAYGPRSYFKTTRARAARAHALGMGWEAACATEHRARGRRGIFSLFRELGKGQSR